MNTPVSRLFAATFAACAACVAHAESRALDPASLWLGGYFTNADFTLRASADAGNIDTGRVDLASGHETLGRARLDLVFWESQGSRSTTTRSAARAATCSTSRSRTRARRTTCIPR